MNSLFDYSYVDNKVQKTLFLLHGTGGSKEDFFFLNEFVKDRYNLVGLQGNSNEEGMARFFKRFSEGIFDLDSIKAESAKLKEFILSWPSSEHVFLGYSNGANILLSTLFYYSEVIRTAVLLHPMLPFSIPEGSLDLSGHQLFLSMGDRDPLVPSGDQEKLINLLKSCHATIELKTYPAGHGITQTEMQDVVSYLQNLG